MTQHLWPKQCLAALSPHTPDTELICHLGPVVPRTFEAEPAQPPALPATASPEPRPCAPQNRSLSTVQTLLITMPFLGKPLSACATTSSQDRQVRLAGCQGWPRLLATAWPLARLLVLFPYQCEGPSAVHVPHRVPLSWAFGSSRSILHS